MIYNIFLKFLYYLTVFFILYFVWYLLLQNQFDPIVSLSQQHKGLGIGRRSQSSIANFVPSSSTLCQVFGPSYLQGPEGTPPCPLLLAASRGWDTFLKVLAAWEVASIHLKCGNWWNCHVAGKLMKTYKVETGLVELSNHKACIERRHARTLTTLAALLETKLNDLRLLEFCSIPKYQLCSCSRHHLVSHWYWLLIAVHDNEK